MGLQRRKEKNLNFSPEGSRRSWKPSRKGEAGVKRSESMPAGGWVISEERAERAGVREICRHDRRDLVRGWTKAGGEARGPAMDREHPLYTHRGVGE